jgi:hypothetical protein
MPVEVEFALQAQTEADTLTARAWDSLWDLLDRILADPEAAQHAPWASYVSSQRMFGSKIPGTDHTVYWWLDGDLVRVPWILKDTGF